MHIGASGVVYGYFTYLLICRIYLAEQFKLYCSSAVFVMLGYGGMIWGVSANTALYFLGKPSVWGSGRGALRSFVCGVEKNGPER